MYLMFSRNGVAGRWCSALTTIGVAIVLSGCALGEAAPETTPVQATGSVDEQAPRTTDAPDAGSQEANEAPEGIQFSGMAADAGIDWAECDPAEATEDWRGNEFEWTLCSTVTGEVVSLYEYTSDQYPGMSSEYTESAYIAPTWGVAADTQAIVSEVVQNLHAAGYQG